MSSKTNRRKLQLGKESIAKLSADQLKRIAGGPDTTAVGCSASCQSDCIHCTGYPCRAQHPAL